MQLKPVVTGFSKMHEEWRHIQSPISNYEFRISNYSISEMGFQMRSNTGKVRQRKVCHVMSRVCRKMAMLCQAGLTVVIYLIIVSSDASIKNLLHHIRREWALLSFHSVCLSVWMSVGHSAIYSLPRLIDHSQIWSEGIYLSLDPCKPFWIPYLPYFRCQSEKYAKFHLFPTCLLYTSDAADE